METTTTTRRGVRKPSKWERKDPTQPSGRLNAESPNVMLHPCTAGHDTCGCMPLEEICCLTCPLPECLLVLNKNTPKRERRGTRQETRAIAIVALLATHTPKEIREKLNLRVEQYRRAIVYIQQHAAPAAYQLMMSHAPADPEKRAASKSAPPAPPDAETLLLLEQLVAERSSSVVKGDRP